MRSVSVRLADLERVTIPIGFEGENEYTNVHIDCKKVFDEDSSFVPTLALVAPSGEKYPGIVTRDGDIVTWVVSASDLAERGAGELQLAFTKDNVIGKTYVARTRVERSITPDGEVPSVIENFIIEAGAIVNGIPQAIEDAIDDVMGDITAEAETLQPGSSASASFDSETKTFTFGIPTGAKGEKGDKGETGEKGADGAKGDKGDPGTNIVPLFSYNNGTLSCNMTFAEVYAAVSNKQCTSCMMGSYANGQGYLLKSSSSFGVSFTRSGTNKNAGQVSETEICLYPDESVQLTPEVVNVSDVIDDTAGTGVTNKTWSADKTLSELQVVPVFTMVNNALTCDMSFADVLAAVRAKKCTACKRMISSTGSSDFYLKSSTSRLITFARLVLSPEDAYVADGVILFRSDESASYVEGMVSLADYIAPRYPVMNFPVEAGQYCIKDGLLYKAKVGIPSYEVFDPTKWENVLIGDELDFAISHGAEIDDTAGAGDTDKAWSANKLTSEFDLKAPKANPEFTGSISMGRMAETTVGNGSVAIGTGTEASAMSAFAEGVNTKATGTAGHAEGVASVASGFVSHAENNGTVASGFASHADGNQTIANHKAQHVFGELNIADDSSETGDNRGNYVEIVGNGDVYSAIRSNARTLDWDGNEELAGDLTIKKGSADEVSVSELAEDVGDLKNQINNSDLALIGRENLLNGISWIDNKYIKGDGTVGDNTSYHMTDKIYLPSSGLYSILFTSNGGYFRVCAYNSDDSVNALLINGSSAVAEKRVLTFTFPSTASYIRTSMQKPGGAHAIILGTNVDNELSTLKSSIGGLKKVGLNCTTPMRFNTSNATLTFPRYTYVFIDNVRYSFESADIVLDYSSISGNSMAVVFENNALAVKSYSNAVVAQNPILFHFTKNALNNPSTNDIFYPYYADGVLFNANSFESVLYVDGANGSDSNDGSSSNPFATIQKAINSNPTMIYVARGTYNETVTILYKERLKIMPWRTPVFSTSVFDVPMIVVNKVDCRASRQIEFIDVYANNPGSGGQAWYIDTVYDATFTHCWASDAEGGGFVTNNLYGKFIQCKAWDIGSSSYVNSDGFNLHGYGTTELIDCIAHDCYDDGISHHDGCVATIKGGEFWNCTHGGGIAPVNRYCEIDGAYCHNNAWGIQATQADTSLYDPYILIKNSVLKDNAQKDISIGEIPCKVLRCSFDTKDIPAGAQYVEIN